MRLKDTLPKFKFIHKLRSSFSYFADFNPEKKIDKYFYDRIKNLLKVSRFIITWSGLLILIASILIVQNYLLSGYYQKLEPIPGGIYNEGVLGTFTTANPIYATSDVDTSISRLIFSGLFSYNSQDKLVGNLASGYTVNKLGNIFTVSLRPNLKWQDNANLTSQDVVFTYKLIQNPNTLSPLFNSWQGIQISSLGPLKVVFKLPDPLASFPEQLTTGILPYHILKNIAPSNLRSASFNTLNPIGSGPFRWQSIAVSGNSPSNAVEKISLIPFQDYRGGSPKLNAFVVNAYADKSELINAFLSGALTSIEGLNTIPKAIKHMPNVKIHNLILTAGVYEFFKTTAGVLADVNVRKALIEATNVSAIIKSLGYVTHAVNEPLLEGQLAYNSSYRQASYNLSGAQSILRQDGWTIGTNGVLQKNGTSLEFNMVVENNSEYLKVAHELQADWSKIRARVQIISLSQAELLNAIQSHDYDSILYGISIGIDPDVFVYWDSTQASIQSSTRLNLSEYSNPVADESLEEGRTRLNPALRVIKYQDFLRAWQQDAPALGLYQPRDLYITNGRLFGLNNTLINSYAGRFNNVQNWEINQANVTDK
jgi:peptide/nickel transport system substrate-binding protein